MGYSYPNQIFNRHPLNLTGGILATRPGVKSLHLFFDESFFTDKREAEDLAGGLFWESLGGSCLVTIGPFPGLPLAGVSAPGEGSQHRIRQTTGEFRYPLYP